MDSGNIALAIAAGGLLLGVARLALAILAYRLDARRSRNGHASASPDTNGAEVDKAHAVQ